MLMWSTIVSSHFRLDDKTNRKENYLLFSSVIVVGSKDISTNENLHKRRCSSCDVHVLFVSQSLVYLYAIVRVLRA
jgi:hypothetical protein